MTVALIHRPYTPDQERELARALDRADPEFSAVLREYRQAVQSDPVPRVPEYLRGETA